MMPQARLILMTLMSSFLIAGCSGGGSRTSTVAFTVNSVTPANVAGGSAGVDTRIAPTVVFSNTIDTSFLTTKSFTLTGPGGVEVPSTVAISGATATLTPNQPLGMITQYTATIAATAKDSSGTSISGKYTWSFTTRDGQWKTQIGEQVDSSAVDVSNAHVAVDAAGNVMAVWQQGSVVYANRHAAGGAWGTPEQISTGTAVNPQIAVDTSGTAIAVWEQGGGVYAKRYASGGWGTLDQISTTGTNPQIAVDAAGDAVAVWQQGNTIYAKRYTANAWDASASKIRDAITAVTSQLAMDASGNAFAIWIEGYNLYASRSAAGSSPAWSTPSPISNSVSFPPLNPRLAVNAKGDAFVVWQEQTGSFNSPGSRIFYNHYVSGTGWNNSSSGVPGITGYAYNPQISVDALGNALCIWVTNTSGPFKNINAARYLVDIPGWEDPVTISNSSVYDQELPRLSMDANGNAIAVWVQSGLSNAIYVNRFRAKTAAWDDVISLAAVSDVNSVAAIPQIAMSPGGSAVVVWAQLDITNTFNNLYANRFE
jgi:hypothetical protein